MTTNEIMRLWVIGIMAASLIVWLIWFIRSPARLYSVPILLWMLNAMVFMVAREVILWDVDPLLLNSWSLAIYIQAGLTLLGVGIYAVVRKVEPRSGG